MGRTRGTPARRRCRGSCGAGALLRAGVLLAAAGWRGWEQGAPGHGAEAAKVNYCCVAISWEPEWCLHPDCLGLGCTSGEVGAGFQCSVGHPPLVCPSALARLVALRVARSPGRRSAHARTRHVLKDRRTGETAAVQLAYELGGLTDNCCCAMERRRISSRVCARASCRTRRCRSARSSRAAGSQNWISSLLKAWCSSTRRSERLFSPARTRGGMQWRGVTNMLLPGRTRSAVSIVITCNGEGLCPPHIFLFF